MFKTYLLTEVSAPRLVQFLFGQVGPYLLQFAIKSKEEQLSELVMLGQLIRARREELMLNLSVFARKVHLSRNQALYIEKGRKTGVPNHVVKAICRVLGLDYCKLEPLEDKRPQSALGRIVRARRTKLGLSQSALGFRIGVSRWYIQQVELGRYKVTDDGIFRRFSEALGIPYEELAKYRLPWSVGFFQKHLDESTLGGYIARHRIRKRFSQAVLGSRSGYTKTVISKIERNVYVPNEDGLKRLGAALYVEIPGHLVKRKNGSERTREKVSRGVEDEQDNI